MNFNNWISFLTAIICAVLGITAWYFKLDFASFYGFTPNWGEITIFMFVMYSVNISLLAKDLLERPAVISGGDYSYRLYAVDDQGKEINNFSEDYVEYQKMICESYAILKDILNPKETK